MTESNEVMHIHVNGHLIGLMGFKEAVAEISRTRIGKTDETIQQALLDLLSAKNYIPASARKSYGLALLREFKKLLGEAVTDEGPSGGLHIMILGEGCPAAIKWRSQSWNS